MKNKPPFSANFGHDDVDLLEKESAYQGFFRLLKIRLRHRLFAGGWTEDVRRELLDRGDASAAILYDPTRDLIGLIDQFRVGVLASEYGPWCLEVVAGMVEPGETPEQVILREIEEEAGLTELVVRPITSYYSSPGGCSEKIHLFCGLCDLSAAGGVHGLKSEQEDILLRVFSAHSIFPVMLNSRMNNAATLIGLQWLQANRYELRREFALTDKE